MRPITKKKWPSAFRVAKADSTVIEMVWLEVTGIDRSYVEGFKVAADIVIDSLQHRRNDKINDELLFPAMLLYRHYLELQMKMLLVNAMQLKIIPNAKIKDGHNLKKLWQKTKAMLLKAFPGGDVKTLLRIQPIVYAMHRFDESGEEFRYWNFKDESPTLRKMPSKVYIGSVKRAIARAFHFFDGVAMSFAAEFDARR